jgi:glucose-6-phosphate dehydrogenase assembly protein OpcA
MRMRGRLALHAESVVIPLLAPDVPVVTWWHLPAPERIAHDPLGVVADRRITDAAECADPIETLRIRADDYAPGDTDLAWTRATPWRTVIASAFDAVRVPVTGVTLRAAPADPTAVLLGGWLTARLGITPQWEATAALDGVRFDFADGGHIELVAAGDAAVALRGSGLPERVLPLGRRALGDDLAEELRRLDPDQTYAAALSAATGRTGLAERSPTRSHVWHDPALAEKPELVYST